MITRFTVGAKDFLPVRIWGQNMRYDSNKHHRRSIRLKGFDYTREGAYFVTICTQNQACLFGEIVNGQMRLNDVGEVADMLAGYSRTFSEGCIRCLCDYAEPCTWYHLDRAGK